MSLEILTILGQYRPVINTEVVIYSVPKGRRAAISLVNIMNNDAGNAIIDLAIVKGGSNDIPGVPTPAYSKILDQFTLNTGKGSNDGFPISGKGITLNEFDDIRFETNTANVVIHVYGVEVIPDKI